MLKPAIIDPYFLKEVFEDRESIDKFRKFFIEEIEPYKNQILFLLDDKENKIKQEYDKLIEETNDGSPLQTFIKHYLLSIFRENYPDNFDTTQLEKVVKKFNFKIIFLKNKNDIENKLNLKNLIRSQDFPLSLDKLKEIFSDFSRFANKIQIIDPYVAVHLTNIDAGKKKRNYENSYGIPNIDDMINKIRNDINFNPNFSIQMKKNNDYKITIKELINIFNNSNIDPNNFNLEIVSTIQNEYVHGISEKINDLEKMITKEEDKIKKQKFEELKTQIETAFYTQSLDKTISDLIKWNIKFKLKALRGKNDDVESKMYRRSIHMESSKKDDGTRIKACMECTPGFNFFSSIKKGLKKDDMYSIKLIFDDPKHTKKLKQAAHHEDFKFKKHNTR